MGPKKKTVKTPETIWDLSDELWAKIEPILREDSPPQPPIKGGRKRIDRRQAFNGIVFRMRTGCQWNQLPKKFGDDSSIHRWFQGWNRNGVIEKIRAYWSPTARDWAPSNGRGRAWTVRWARPGLAATTSAQIPRIAGETA